jgi:L-malate glycosyltransferase
MPLKILAISNYRDFHTARPEAEIFIGLARRGHQVHIMTYGDAAYADKFREAGIKVIDFHPRKKFDKGEIAFIRKELIKEGHDVIHLFNGKSIINGIRAAKGLAVKVVLYRGYTGNIHWYDPTAYLKFLHPRVDGIFCNSIGVENLIRSQLFFRKKKARTINKGHRTEWYQAYDPINLKAELNLPEDAFLVVNVANNRKMKGIPYLLEAITKLPSDLPVHLLLVGRDMDLEPNLKILEHSANKHKVHFLGFRKDALNVVASCDVFVLSSLFGESITKSVIEAMSLGIAPIITDIPGNSELVVNGKSGVVVPLKDGAAIARSILTLFKDRDLLDSIRRNAKLHIENNLNTDRTIELTEQFYMDLISSNR